MKTMQFKLPMAVSLLCGMLACSGGEEPMDGGSDGGVDAGWDGGSTDVDAGDVDSGLSEECNKPANLARIQALQAAQPELEVRTRDILTVTSTFASLADDPSEICSVALRFKDSNGSGAVEPYEDWTRTAEARAADLVARMTRAEKVGLVLHPTLSDVPSGQGELSTALTQDITDKHVRFGATEAGAAPLTARAFWANNIQALAEGEPHGIPFVLSVGPSHSTGNGRTKATGFSQWPAELGLGATGDLSMIEGFGGVVSQELRAVGVRMLRDVSADLATEPRWYGAQFTFGEDSGQVADRVHQILGLGIEQGGGGAQPLTYIFAAAVFLFCFFSYRRTSEFDRTTRLFFRLGMIGAAAVAALHFLFWNVVVYLPKAPPSGGG